MVDRYTKIVLTVIAGALVSLVGQNAAHPAKADNGIQRVFLCQAIDSCLGFRVNPKTGLPSLPVID